MQDTTTVVKSTEKVADPLANLNVDGKEVEVEVVEDPKQIMASKLVDSLMATYNTPTGAVMTIGAIGEQESRAINTISKSLNSPLKNLMSEKSVGNQVGNQLVELKVKIDEINPGKYNLNPGWMGRIIQKVTGNSAINKYVTKFETTGNVIKSIANNLEEGMLTLQENNLIFADDQSRYRQIANALTEKIDVMNATQEQLRRAIAVERDEMKKKFLEEEVLFGLNQRLMDMLSLKSVCQQGDAAIQVLIANNNQLISSVKRTKEITLVAMNIGAQIAVGLDQQARVMHSVAVVTEATDNLLVSNGKMLKEQGAEIHKQASSAMINVEKLANAINDTIAAIEDIENFKRAALPNMQASIDKLNLLTDETQSKLTQLQKGETARIQHFEDAK